MGCILVTGVLLILSFAVIVKSDGTLVLDTSRITLGALPVALGQPGLEPSKSPTGCI